MLDNIVKYFFDLTNNFRKQRFFQRNPHVQEAFDTFKSSPYKDYDVVSDHMLNTFISVCGQGIS